MKSIKQCFVVFLLCLTGAVHAEDLLQYVEYCKNSLGFQTLPELNCNDGDVFAPNSGFRGDETNDYMGYHKVSDDIDLVFACRWLGDEFQNPERGFQSSRSIELQVHKRSTGATCFFSAIEHDLDIYDEQGNVVSTRTDSASTAIKSPTASDADTYWRSPVEMDAEVPCVGCHAAGTYIASPRIAPFLSKYGLLNNGHDTLNIFPEGSLEHPARRFHAVAGEPGSIFHSWNARIHDDSVVVTNDCSTGCHSIVDPAQSPPPRCPNGSCAGGRIIIPSIASDLGAVISAGVMEPRDPHSAYRWINRDSNDEGKDEELYTGAQQEYTYLMESCTSPTVLEARAVGSDFTFSTADVFPEKLAFFNLREGLRCVDNQQSDGKCNDYETRYFCPKKSLGEDNYWTQEWADAWYDVDDPLPTTDDESRTALAQAGINICDGDEPLAIQARVKTPGALFSAFGANDRLNQFSASGLVCRDSDQVAGGKCSNYVVRYKNCSSEAYPKSNFYEIVVRANSGFFATGTINAYVDNVPLTMWDQSKDILDGTNNYVFRTNGTGVLTVNISNGANIEYVTVNGSVRQAQGEVSGDTSSPIIVRARGTSGAEVIKVTVAGTEVARYTLSTSWNEYSVVTDLSGGVNVEFINDAAGRDVELDWVTINGQVRQTEAQTYNTATYANGRCGGGTGSTMHCNGIIGFGDIRNSLYHAEGQSYGYIDSLPMPNVVTVVDEFSAWDNGYCGRLIAHNTTSSSQNIRFDFEITKGNIYDSWNYNSAGGKTTGVISGTPKSNMPQRIGPYERSDFASFGYCVED